MRPQDYDSFVEVVAGFAELKGKHLSAPAIELYWRAMQHWTIEEFRRAAEHLLKTCEWFPTPKHFEDLRKEIRITPSEAWDRVMAHCEGAWRTGKGCGDGQIDTVVRMLGGYGTIALHPRDKLTFIERRFCEHYQQLEDAVATRDALARLGIDPYAEPGKCLAEIGTERRRLT